MIDTKHQHVIICSGGSSDNSGFSTRPTVTAINLKDSRNINNEVDTTIYYDDGWVIRWREGVRVTGWMVKWLGERVGGWSNGFWVAGWTARWINGFWMVGWTARCVGEWVESCSVGW